MTEDNAARTCYFKHFAIPARKLDNESPNFVASVKGQEVFRLSILLQPSHSSYYGIVGSWAYSDLGNL